MVKALSYINPIRLIACIAVILFTLLITTSAHAQTTSTSSGPQYWTATSASSCASLSGEWCPAMSGGMAWCGSVGSCPINDQGACQAAGRTWCVMNGMGGCAMSGTACMGGSTTAAPPSTGTTSAAPTTGTTTTVTAPVVAAPVSFYTATNTTDCTTRGGEWCSSNGTTWCGSPGSCPISTKADCEAKGRSWCTSTFGSGGCAMERYDCSGNYAGYKAPAPSPAPTTPTTTATSTPIATPAPTTTTQTFSWPTSKTDCTTYYGKWCGNNETAGYCVMAHKSCVAVAKPGYISCWDGTILSANATCPSMPTTEIFCGQAGKFWCNYNVLQSGTAIRGGWCSSEPCPPSPPEGSMTCPDGRSFQKNLAECPKDRSIVPEYETCAGGEKVIKGKESCPVLVQCKDGKQVADINMCTIEPDPIEVCMRSGGHWCANTQGNKTGFCGKTAAACAKSDDQSSESLSAKEITALERLRKTTIRELEQVAHMFVKLKDDESLANTKSLSAKVAAIEFTDRSAFKTFESIRDSIEALRAVAEKTGGDDEGKTRDEKAEERSLERMKIGLRSFSRTLDMRTKQLEKFRKQGGKVSPEITEIIAKVKATIESILQETDYERAQDTVEQLPDLIEDLNEQFRKIDMLKRLSRVIGVVNKRVTTMNKAVADAVKIAKRQGLDIALMQRALDGQLEVETAVNNLKTGSVDTDEDLYEYIQEQIFDKATTVETIANSMKTYASAKKQFASQELRIRRFDARITVMEKNDTEGAEEARALLTNLRQNLSDLSALITKGISPENAEAAFELWNSVKEADAELNLLLKLTKPNALETQLKKSIQGEFTPQVQELEVDTVESLIVSAHRVANAFVSRMSPYRNLAFE